MAGSGDKCISDAAYRSAATAQAGAIVEQATVDAAIAVALALYQRNSSRDITKLRNDIAADQVALAEATLAHAQAFWPQESQLVEDVFGEAKAVADYSTLTDQWRRLAESSMQAGREKWLAELRSQCRVAGGCAETRWQRNSKLAQADSISFAARQTEGRVETINDRRYETRFAVLKLGRGQVADIRGYQAVGLTTGAGASGFITGSINSALSAYGFYSAREQSPQWGHAAGIRSKWGVPYSPPAAASSPGGYSASTYPLSSSSAVTTQPLPSGKDTEIDDGFNIYQQAVEQGYFRR